MNLKQSAAFSLGLVLCAVNTTTFAGFRPGAFLVRPGVGHYFPAHKRHLEGAGVSSLTLGYDVTDRWGIAAGATVINTNHKAGYGASNVHGFLYTLDGVYHLNDFHGWSPYLMAGPQVTSLKPPTGLDPVTQVGASVGGGLGYFISNSIAFTVEARDLYTFSGGKNDVVWTYGLTFLFGGSTTPPSA